MHIWSNFFIHVASASPFAYVNSLQHIYTTEHILLYAPPYVNLLMQIASDANLHNSKSVNGDVVVLHMCCAHLS